MSCVRISSLKRGGRLMVLASVVLLLVCPAPAQEKLGDLVSEYGFDWMIGRWTATTDGGDVIELDHRWALDKHVVTVGLKMGEYEYRGMILYIPSEEEVVEVGADNRGGMGKGTWEPDGERVVSKSERVEANGTKHNMAIFYSKVGRKTIRVELYGIDSAGELAAEPWGTVNFERQKRQAPKGKKPAGAAEAAAESLKAVVQEAGFGWMAGRWVATTDRGQMESFYRWGLGGHMVSIGFKGGEMEGLGMIYYSPVDGQVVQFGADNRGGSVKGLWDVDGETAVTTLEYTGPDGQRRKMGITHTKVDRKTSKVGYHRVESNGELSDEALGTLEYKRQKRQASGVKKKSGS